MPRKCDNCGSYKMKGDKCLHIFKQKDGSFVAKRTVDSIEDRVSIVWVCKQCGFKGTHLIRPFKLVNGQYVIDNLGNVK